jgi:hypothetical protein
MVLRVAKHRKKQFPASYLEKKRKDREKSKKTEEGKRERKSRGKG